MAGVIVPPRPPARARRRLSRRAGLVLGLTGLEAVHLGAQTIPDYELPPIRYSVSPASNGVSALQRRLDTGALQLRGTDDRDTVQRCLAAFDVPIASQVLVFSKTSLQRQRISPQTPRALYFSDDTYVGWVPGGLMEVATIDAQLGLVFYRLDPRGAAGPLRFERDADCLACHAGPLTRDWPGLIIRSVHPDAAGEPISRAGSFLTGQESPLAERWGGWYVTGRHGAARHLGNSIAREDGEAVTIDRERGANVTNLAPFTVTTPFPRADSDLVALMILEHQVGMHNRLAAGALRVRKWIHYQEALSTEMGETGSPTPTGTARRVVELEAEHILEHLLFVGEAALPEGGVQGGPDFPRAFGRNRHTDSRGRSLKDLDLRTRLFTHRCSYLIDSPAFDHLPSPLKAEILRRLGTILTAGTPPTPFTHLDTTERRAIYEILTATRPDFTAGWNPPLVAPSH